MISTSNLPKLPGVYLFKNKDSEIIYIGKAKSLRSRVRSYFKGNNHSSKTQFLVRNIADMEYIIVNNEVELKPIGVVTDRDIVCRAVARGINPLSMSAEECMSEPCITVNPETMIEDCCKILEEKQVRRLPVVDERGCCCGIVSQADIATHHLKDKIVQVLEEVSQPHK